MLISIASQGARLAGRSVSTSLKLQRAGRAKLAWQPHPLSPRTLSTASADPAKAAAKPPSLAAITLVSVTVVGAAVTYGVYLAVHGLVVETETDATQLLNTMHSIEGNFDTANHMREQYHGSTRRH